MNFKFLFFIICLLFIYLLLENNEQIEYFKNKSHTFNIILVDDDLSRKKGLMFRKKKLGGNNGMLFHFNKKPKSIKSVWMKNTFIPLDILFLDSNMVVVDLYKNMIPLSEKSIYSKVKCNHFLEIDSGEVGRLKVEVGDKILFNQIKDK